jgi:RNA polymerase sigma-70 factor (ECF subfamily)
MYAIDNLSHKEIAQYLNTTESNSKSILSRARKMLKDLIEETQRNNQID